MLNMKRLRLVLTITTIPKTASADENFAENAMISTSQGLDEVHEQTTIYNGPFAEQNEDESQNPAEETIAATYASTNRG